MFRSCYVEVNRVLNGTSSTTTFDRQHLTMACPDASSMRTTKDDPHDIMRTVEEERNVDAAREIVRHLKQSQHSEILIAVYNNKGGVLKSTITAEIGSMLSDMGVNTMLVDLDSQCSLTENLLKVDLPVHTIDMNSRVRQEDPGNPEGIKLAPGNYSVYDGLTWLAREEDLDRSPVAVTPIKLRDEGEQAIQAEPAEIRTTPQRLAACLQDHLNRGKCDHVGSLHLIIGHHNLTAISTELAVARVNKEKSKNSYHASPIWVIKKTMRDAKSNIALIDLNPDASELNRTIMMQADFVLIPTWADKDGVKCMVDLKCRIMASLDEDDPTMNRGAYKTKNKDSWAQIHMDLIQETANVGDHEGIPLRVCDKWPKLLGLVVNSKEQYRHIHGQHHQRMFDTLLARYGTMTEKFSSRRPDGIHVARLVGGTQLNRQGIDRYPALQMANPRFIACHGGIWNTETPKILAGKKRKPVSQMSMADLEETQLRHLVNVAEMHHRVHMITRSILHNLALSFGIATEGIRNNVQIP